MGEAHPLKHETACGLHASSIAAPVQKPSRAKVLEDIQALAGADVPVALLLDLPKQVPRQYLNHNAGLWPVVACACPSAAAWLTDGP